MSWTKKNLALGVAALALINVNVAVARAIVIKSAGPSVKSYTPGKVIADNSSVTLKAGDTLTLLDGQGTRVLKGPGVFATTATTQTSSNLTTMFKNTGTRQVRTGAVRGVNTGAPPRPSNIWLIDTSKSATVCVADTSAVSLWTPSGEAVSKLTLTRVSDGKSVPLDMRPMQSVRAWPIEELPITDASEFRVTREASAASVTLHFATLGPNPQGVENTIASFVRSGCTTQLDMLIEAMSARLADETPAG